LNVIGGEADTIRLSALQEFTVAIEPFSQSPDSFLAGLCRAHAGVKTVHPTIGMKAPKDMAHFVAPA
jgi:hypothetical protein